MIRCDDSGLGSPKLEPARTRAGLWLPALAMALGGLTACSTLPSATSLETGTLGSIAPSLETSSVGPTETYTRLARGANACWFGASGPLAKVYIMHAAARSAYEGGEVEIAIHERDFTSPHPWGATVYRVTLTPFGTSVTQVGAENRGLPDAIDAALRADLRRWSQGDLSCGAQWQGLVVALPARVERTSTEPKPDVAAVIKPKAQP